LGLLQRRLESTGTQSEGDLSGDGLITRRDVALLVGLFGRDYSPGSPSPAAPLASNDRGLSDRLLVSVRRRGAAVDQVLADEVEAPLATEVSLKLTARVHRARRS
jgi:hypothetical protein